MNQNLIILQGKVQLPIEQKTVDGKERLRFKILSTMENPSGKSTITETPIIYFDNNNFIDKLKEDMDIIVEGRVSYFDAPESGHLGYVNAYKIHEVG